MEKLVCSYCHQQDVPNTSMRRQALKENRPVFCGRVCYGHYRRDHPNRLQAAQEGYWTSPDVEKNFAKHLDPHYYSNGGFHRKELRREWQGRLAHV